MKTPNTPWRFALALMLGLAALIGAPGGLAQEEMDTPEAAPAAEESVSVDQDAEAAPDVAAEATRPPRRRTHGDRVAIFQDLRVEADEIVDGAAVCIGCTAVIHGDIVRELVVVGGTVELSGSVGREMTCVLSNITLAETARVGREFFNILGDLDDAGADLEGGKVNISAPISLPFRVGGPFPILVALLAWGRLLSVLLLFVVILILAAFVPERIRLMSDEIGPNLGMAYLVGLLGYAVLLIVQPVLYFILISSVIGIPAIPIIALVIFILITLGTAAMFHCIGMRLGHGMNRSMSLLGAIFLGFLPFALLLVLPAFFGFAGLIVALLMKFLFWLVIKVPALGLVILTRVGGRPRLPQPGIADSPAPLTPTAPAAPPSDPGPPTMPEPPPSAPTP